MEEAAAAVALVLAVGNRSRTICSNNFGSYLTVGGWGLESQCLAILAQARDFILLPPALLLLQCTCQYYYYLSSYLQTDQPTSQGAATTTRLALPSLFCTAPIPRCCRVCRAATGQLGLPSLRCPSGCAPLRALRRGRIGRIMQAVSLLLQLACENFRMKIRAGCFSWIVFLVMMVP